jgi:glyoxalase family protein
MAARVVPGIHHVTAIAGEPQRNLDFYTQTLGLRLVKKTVNFDDPGTYHFYFADAAGTPGSIMTFFPWPGAYQGRSGVGMASGTAFSIPSSSVDFWASRLHELSVDFDEPATRLGEPVITLHDPDGLVIELIGIEGQASTSGDWDYASVPAEHRIHGFHSVTLCVAGFEQTAKLLKETFGYESAGEEIDRFRFRTPSGEQAAIVDLHIQPDQLPRGRMGSGTVHHVAFRAHNEQDQLECRETIASLGFNVTPVLDRQYFRSIYFREPGGVLFEIATDPPGFTRDETFDELGTHLKLPPWFEPQRERIEARLPKVGLPGSPDALAIGKSEVDS